MFASVLEVLGYNLTRLEEYRRRQVAFLHALTLMRAGKKDRHEPLGRNKFQRTSHDRASVEVPPAEAKFQIALEPKGPVGEPPFAGLLNFEKTIVFREPLRLANRSVLELICLPSHCQISGPGIFGFTATYT
jgi:hypothetical protein